MLALVAPWRVAYLPICQLFLFTTVIFIFTATGKLHTSYMIGYGVLCQNKSQPKSACMYVRTYMYVCMYVCTYMYVCYSMYVCMYVRTYVHTYKHTNVCTYVCTYGRTYVCTVRTYVHSYVHTYVCIYECMYVCMYVLLSDCIGNIQWFGGLPCTHLCPLASTLPLFLTYSYSCFSFHLIKCIYIYIYIYYNEQSGLGNQK